MSGQAPKVLVATLWQRRSGRGNEYLSGFLGKARIVGFRGEPTADGTPTWDIYLQPGKEQDERAGGQVQHSRQASNAVLPPARAKLWERGAAENPGSNQPFYEDPVDDTRGER
jgi:hypothetical protein